MPVHSQTNCKFTTPKVNAGIGSTKNNKHYQIVTINAAFLAAMAAFSHKYFLLFIETDFYCVAVSL